MIQGQVLAGDLADHLRELVDAHQFGRPDVHRTLEVGVHQSSNSLNRFINVKEGSSLFSISVYID